MILQYPDSKLVPEAKQRLLEVQEVLAEREFGIGPLSTTCASLIRRRSRACSRWWKSILSTAAPTRHSICWVRTMKDRFARLRSAPTCDVHGLPRGCATEAVKGRYIGELTKKASEEYSRILTRYPLMDAPMMPKSVWHLLHQPIPRPTKGAVAQNKAELASRSGVEHVAEDDADREERARRCLGRQGRGTIACRSGAGSCDLGRPQ